jgi:hypothetical protein
MIKGLGLAALLAVASGIACADTIVLASGESFVNVPTSIVNPLGTNCGVTGNASGNCGYLGTGPYWDNESGKGNEMNIAYVLTGTCGTPADCPTNYNPLQYVAGNSSGSQPTSITLDDTSNDAAVTLLGDSTGDTTDSFGYYNVSNPSVLYTLYGPGSMVGDIGIPVNLSSLISGGDYGFFITKSCHTLCPAGDPTPGFVTWYSDESLDLSDVGNQHFAIFTSPTTGEYYIGIEDWGIFGGAGNGEGNGDFDDIVFELTTSVPEPSTFGLIGAGLLGLGLTRLRARKSRA